MLYALVVFVALNQSDLQATGRDTPPQTYTIELVDPKPDKGNTLVMTPNTDLVVSIRISNVSREFTPTFVSARFLRGKAWAGDFVAKPKWVNEKVVEYKTTVRSPRTKGVYDLVVVPLDIEASLPGAPAKEKYPKAIKVTVR